MRKQQAGYLAVIAILLILIIGFLGTSIIANYAGTANALGYYSQGEQALYIAEAGFEQAARRLMTPLLTGTNSRIACTGITGNVDLTNKTFGTGTFTATAVSGNPVVAATLTTAAITASATTIPVTSTTGFASAGRIMIDHEIINYGGTTTTSFTGVQRGVNLSNNTAHSISSPVSQFQCMVEIDAGIPNLTSSVYKRNIQQGLMMQDAWLVGDIVASSEFNVARYNYPVGDNWNDYSFANANKGNLNAVSMVSNADGWATGDVVSGNYNFLHWNGSSWALSTLAAQCTVGHLAGISAVNSDEAWAVGIRYRSTGGCSSGGSQRYSILRWNGSTWTQLTPTTTPAIPADSSNNQNLNAVMVIATTQTGVGNLGFAVGNAGRILEYNGSSWTLDTSPVTTNLMGVSVVSSTEAWSVGASGRILRWNGSTWSIASSPTSTQLNAIAMLDTDLDGQANVGWAVGNSGVILYYDGTTWSVSSSPVSSNLYGVALFNNNNDAWAVGASNTLLHFNGTSWTSETSMTSNALNAISTIAPQQYPFAWQEIYA